MAPQDTSSPGTESSSEREHSLAVGSASDSAPSVHSLSVSKSAALSYISKKLDPQRNWFDQNARRSKLFHYSLLGASTVATASIVVANSMHLPALSTGLAVVATIATGFSGMVKFQEHWIRYRNTATALEGLKLRYEVGMHPFEGSDKHGLLIEEAEKIFAQEQSQWAAKSAENVRQPTSSN